MHDSLMALITRAGALTLRELFSRVGDHPEVRRRLARLLKDGNLRIEVIEGQEDPIEVDRLTEDELIEQLGAEGAAERLEVIPTAKGWHGPLR